MKAHPRRNRFTALSAERFQIDKPDKNPAASNLPPRDPPSAPSAEETGAAPDETQLTLPRLTGLSTAPAQSAPPVELPLAFRPLFSPAAHREDRQIFPFRLMLVPLACLALGGLGGFLVSRTSKPATGSVAPGSLPEGVNLLTTAEQEELDAAYAARRAHRFAEAAQRFTALGRKHPNWRAMEVEAGVTLLDQGKMEPAEASLQASADKGPMPADANYFLGAVHLKNKAYPEAKASLEKSVALDPSRPEFYYLWGECLREEGKPLEAATRFRCALLRSRSESTEGLYRLKLWLSEIEADRENNDGIGAEIDGALSQPRPPMEALFAAAARDLKSDDIHAAAGHLFRARRRTDPKVLRTILDDPVFAQVRARPELAELFQSASLAADPGSDQATGSPALSDPGSEPGPVFPTPAFAVPTNGE